MLKWTKTGRDERGWQADGQGGRRYQIEMRAGFNLLPTVDGMKLVKRETLEDAQSIAAAYETTFRQADRYKWWYTIMYRTFIAYCEKFPDKSTANLMQRTCDDMDAKFPTFRGGFDHSHVVDALQWHNKKKKVGAR